MDIEKVYGMTDYYDTRAGRVKVVQKCLDYGFTAEMIIDTLYDYSAKFAYKCTDSFCPVADKTRPNVNKLRYPGFASQEALEHHRLVDHTEHEHYNVHYNIMHHPWYVCQCGHYASLNDDERELYELGKFHGVPQERLDHLEKVREHANSN